jgi:hypothetical protein
MVFCRPSAGLTGELGSWSGDEEQLFLDLLLEWLLGGGVGREPVDVAD